jgi:hypothetical protein
MKHASNKAGGNKNQLGHQPVLAAQIMEAAKRQETVNQQKASANGPGLFIKYLQDYYESLDGLFTDNTSGQQNNTFQYE